MRGECLGIMASPEVTLERLYFVIHGWLLLRPQEA